MAQELRVSFPSRNARYSSPVTLPPTIDEAVARLRNGGLVAFPTETVYGLGADAGNPAAIRRIFQVKGRPTNHPLIVHIGSASELVTVARHVPPAAAHLAARFWPGALTLILPRAERISREVTGGQDTVAVRVPQHPLALQLLKSFAAGVAAPSANRFGAVSPTCAEHVRRDLGADVDLVLDGGPCEIGVESTIVDLSREHAYLLRPGGVPVEAIEDALGSQLLIESQGAVRAPGQLPSHYAPRAALLVLPAAELAPRAAALMASGARVGVLAPEGTRVPRVHASLLVSEQPSGYARALYASLRDLDARGVDAILVVAPSEHGVGRAVIDRLRRAAAPRAESGSGRTPHAPSAQAGGRARSTSGGNGL
jgi:L-threonylcarbamoyladenylate synthase